MTKTLNSAATPASPGMLANSGMKATNRFAPHPQIPAAFANAAKKIKRLRTSEKERRRKARFDHAYNY
jgi:hypothetical protein